MPALVTLASDNFNRADVNPIPSPWQTYSGISNLQIVSNQVEASIINATVDTAETHNAILPNDQWAQVTLVSRLAGSTYFALALFLRFAAPNTVSGYFLSMENHGAPGPTVTIYKYTTGTQATLSTQPNITLTAGDVFRFEALGTQLTGFQNGTQVVQVTDSSYTGGFAGIEAYPTVAVSDVVLDSFSCGGFTSLGKFYRGVSHGIYHGVH